MCRSRQKKASRLNPIEAAADAARRGSRASPLPALALSLVIWGLYISPAIAGSHPEITVIPMGQGLLQRGSADDSYRLPLGANGPLPQALVLVARQPEMVDVNLPLAAGATDEDRKVQVPATVRFQVAGKDLPPWNLHKFPTAFVINQETIRGNPEYATGRLAIHVDLQTDADMVALTVLGMPDFSLASDSLDGPLSAFYEAAEDEEIKSYFQALAQEIGGNKSLARAEYRKLVDSPNRRLARFARRGLRMLSYDLRPYKLSGNFTEHYRWGLFLQQCGVFAPAFKEFEECRLVYPREAESQFRAGELLDRLESNPFKASDYMERCSQGEFDSDPVQWHLLMVILRSRDNMTIDARRVLELKASWVLAQYSIWAATRGKIVPLLSTFEITDESEFDYREYSGGVWGPADDIVSERGWFDGVFSITPRPEGNQAPAVTTIGPDQGPNGAALSAMYGDAQVEDFLRAWFEQFAWAATIGEIGDSFPLPEQVDDCGHPPAPNRAYSMRAALRYHFDQRMFERAKISIAPAASQHIRSWRVEGPFPIADPATAGRPVAGSGEPRHHVLDPLPSGGKEQGVELFSQTDFIHLDRLWPDAGPALARATSWVFFPEDEEVRMWLGQNDGMAVWVNGRCIHQGRYYAAHNYADRPLVDTVASFAPLKSGWNEIQIVVESLPAPHNRGWGFSLRLSDWDGEPIEGLAYLNVPPSSDLARPDAPQQVGRHYEWRAVRRNYRELLPRLTGDDLASITGLKGLSIEGLIAPKGGFFSVQAPNRSPGDTYRPLSEPWHSGQDQDTVLNNVLDWEREACAAVRYEKDGKQRDLLFVKPEALEAYLTLLKEPTGSSALFADLTPGQRLLGYVSVRAEAGGRILFVVDTLLSEGANWPVDEEDLLEPISDHYYANPTHTFPPYSPPQQPQ